MTKTPPSKEKVRHWLDEQVHSKNPPTPEQIRRELGWDLEEAEREERLRHESDTEGGATD